MKIGNYYIDLNELSSYTFRCNSLVCVQRKACCCQVYDVDISKYEMEKIICYFDMISKFCHDLKVGDYYKNVFEKCEGRFAIDHNDNDYCVFSYFDKNRYLRCGIHTAALELGIDPVSLKPLSCSIWPLSVKDKKTYKVIELSSTREWACVNLKKNCDDSVQDIFLKIINLITKSDF